MIGLLLASCCWAQNIETIKHIPITNALLKSLSGLEGTPEDLAEISVQNNHLLVVGAGDNNEGFLFHLNFYLKEANGEYKKLLQTDLRGIFQESVSPDKDWVTIKKLSRDRSIQIVAHLRGSRVYSGETIFSYDPAAKKMTFLQNPGQIIEFKDFDGDGTYEIIASEDNNLGFTIPLGIFNVLNDHLVNVDEKYPEYYRGLTKEYENYLHKNPNIPYEETARIIKICLLRSYINAHMYKKGNAFARILYQEYSQRIQNLKDKPNFSLIKKQYTGDLEYINSVIEMKPNASK